MTPAPKSNKDVCPKIIPFQCLAVRHILGAAVIIATLTGGCFVWGTEVAKDLIDQRAELGSTAHAKRLMDLDIKLDRLMERSAVVESDVSWLKANLERRFTEEQ